MEDKNYIIISIAAQKLFEKIQYPFMMKNFNKFDLEGIYINITKVIYDKPIANIILNNEKLSDFQVLLLS
jgi:hypothetical protein